MQADGERAAYESRVRCEWCYRGAAHTILSEVPPNTPARHVVNVRFAEDHPVEAFLLSLAYDHRQGALERMQQRAILDARRAHAGAPHRCSWCGGTCPGHD